MVGFGTTNGHEWTGWAGPANSLALVDAGGCWAGVASWVTGAQVMRR